MRLPLLFITLVEMLFTLLGYQQTTHISIKSTANVCSKILNQEGVNERKKDEVGERIFDSDISTKSLQIAKLGKRQKPSQDVDTDLNG